MTNAILDVWDRRNRWIRKGILNFLMSWTDKTARVCLCVCVGLCVCVSARVEGPMAQNWSLGYAQPMRNLCATYARNQGGRKKNQFLMSGTWAWCVHVSFITKIKQTRILDRSNWWMVHTFWTCAIKMKHPSQGNFLAPMRGPSFDLCAGNLLTNSRSRL